MDLVTLLGNCQNPGETTLCPVLLFKVLDGIHVLACLALIVRQALLDFCCDDKQQ